MGSGHECFQFLDHTADVQIKAWGFNLREAFENAAIAMTAYITEIDKVEISKKESIQVEADDLLGLLFRFLDSVLFLFNAEPYLLSKRVRILEFQTPSSIAISEADDTSKPKYFIKADCYGEEFSMEKHPQGTEIKAITYSNMQIIDNESEHQVLFIVDI